MTESKIQTKLNLAPTQPKKVEKEIKKVKTVSTISPTVEVPTNQQQQRVEKNLITLQGFTTSPVQQALKADNPYPARVFLNIGCEYLNGKCGRSDCGNKQEDIPVFFRIKDEIKSQFREFLDPNNIGTYELEISQCPFCKQTLETKYYRKWCWNKECVKELELFEKSGNWIKPKIKKGSYLEVQGHYSKSDKSRLSFTAYSYQLLNQVANQEILTRVQS